jgi:hypothetical protein
LIRREERAIVHTFTKLQGVETKNRKITKGIYAEPFEILLPASLPSSTQFPRTEGNKFRGRIQYKLRAEIGEFSFSKVFQVVSCRMNDDLVPCIVQPTTHEILQSKFLGKGFVSIAACVDDSHIGRGQNLNGSISGKNHSSADIERISIKLVESIEYNVCFHGRTSVLKNVLVETKDVNLSRFSKYLNYSSRTSKRQNNERIHSTHKEILRNLVSGENQFQLIVPNSARDTYDGNLIKISHYLKVAFHTKLSVTDICIKIPIIIGSPRRKISECSVVSRVSNEQFAAVVGQDIIPLENSGLCEKSSSVEDGYNIPIANLVILSPNESVHHIGASTTFFHGKNSDYNDDLDQYDCGIIYRLNPIPSAPDESLFEQDYIAAPLKEITGRLSFLDLSTHNNPSPRSTYMPYEMYSNTPHRERGNSIGDRSMTESIAESSYAQEPFRQRIESYSYDDETTVSGFTEQPDKPDIGHAQQYLTPTPSLSQAQRTKVLFDQLLKELSGSIHDYEIIAGRARQPEYQELFSSLSPNGLGRIISTVTMSYQIQVAVLLARYLVFSSSFSCAHCAGAVKNSSTYSRTNMVETLVPYCHDLSRNRTIIESELDDWERSVTANAFDDLS